MRGLPITSIIRCTYYCKKIFFRFTSKFVPKCRRSTCGVGGGGGVLGLIFAGYVPLASQSSQCPCLIIVYLVILWSIIDPILVTFGQICNFRDPNLAVTFYLCIYLILHEKHLTFHLRYKHSGTKRLPTQNMKNCLYTPKSENVRRHSSNPIESATPS